jgi:arabinofuranosyltransferase
LIGRLARGARERLDPWLAEGSRPLAVLLLAGLALYAVVLVRTAWVSDDAFITLRTVDNFVHGHGLRWNVAERVQSFTHPLWMMVLVPLHAMFEQPMVTLLVPAFAASLAAIALIGFGPGQLRRSAAVALIAAIGSRAFVDYSTSGLEDPLTHLLLVGLILVLGEESVPSPSRLLLAGLLAGLCVLNRMDTLLLVAPALAWLAWSAPRAKRLLTMAAGFVPFLAWEAFALVYYGSPLPNTAPAKLGSGIPAGELLVQGLHYLGHSALHDPVTLGAIVLAFVFALWRPSPLRIAWALGAALYLAYVMKIGGDFMAGRMLTAPFVVALTWLARSHGPPVPGARGIALAIIVALCVAAPRPPWLSGTHYGEDRRDLITERGISDERRYYFPVSGWLSASESAARPAPSSPLRLKGEEARRIGAPLLVEGAVGFVGYHAGPDVHVVDYHGLCDPLLARLPALRDEDVSGEAGWRIGHFERAVPRGYLESLLTGGNRLEDPRLAALYEQVQLRARAPLLAPGRLASVLRGLLGLDPDPPAIAPQVRVPWGEVIGLRPDDPVASLELARLARGEGSLDAARRRIAAAIQAAPGFVPARIEAAEIAGRAGDAGRAIEHLRQALQRAPEHGEVHYRLGESLLRLGRPGPALEAFRRSLAWDPGLAAAHANIGLCHVRLGALEPALRKLVDALQRVDDPANVYQNLAGVLLQLGRRERAAQALEHAVEAHEARGRSEAAERLRQRLRQLPGGGS